MALVPMKKKKREEHSDHEKAEMKILINIRHFVNIFKAKFWVSFILSIPVVAYSGTSRRSFLATRLAIFRLAISSACFILNYFLLWRLRFHNFSLSGTAGETSPG